MLLKGNAMRNSRSQKSISIVLWIVTVLMAFVIFCFSAQSGERSSQLSNGVAEALTSSGTEGISTFLIRKGAHFLEYSFFAFLIVLSLAFSGKHLALSVTDVFIAFFASVAYASSDEIHQLFVEGRVGSYIDVLIDVAGAVFGAVLGACITYLIIKKSNRAGSV